MNIASILDNSIGKLITLKWTLFFIIVVYLIPKSVYVYPGVGIDSSFGLALNMAIKQGLVFGKDIVYTFGPLAYLSTARPNYVPDLLILLFYLFVCLNSIYIIYYFFRSTKSKVELTFVFILLFISGHFLFLRDSITLYFFLIFHIFHYLKHKNNISLVILSTSCILSFYIKVNAGIIMNVVFILFIIYNYIFNTVNYSKNTILFAGHFFVLWLLSFFLNTNFIDYIINSIPIIDSYNDAMVISLWDKSTLLIPVFIFLMITLLFFKSIKSIFNSHHDIFLFFNIFLLNFILFKQSFVRADSWHLSFFFLGISYTLIFIYLYTDINKLKGGISYCIIIASVLSISKIDEPLVNQINKNIGTYLFTNNSKINVTSNNNRNLPKNVLKKIGNKTVDLLGYETTYIFYNKLKYNPRPIFQSYSAYDPKLIDLNSKKYNSETAPDYVLYHFGTIDGRYPFWDEPKTYLSLFKNYSITDRIPNENNIISDLALFKKNTTSRTISKKNIKDTMITLNSKIKIPKSENILYLTIESEYTLLGKIKRTLFQPYLVYMDIDYEDKDKSHNRLILPIMKSGVPINKKVLSFNDAYTFFNSTGKDNIDAISFVLKGNERWIKNTFRIKFIEYKID